MSFQFKPAKREGTFVIVGLMGPTGSGKTWTALEMATGLAGGEKFAVLDTEAGKAKHYADDFDFDHGDLGPPFGPARYQEAIAAAEKYPVIVVDSFSHEHAGEGGLLDMHDAAVNRMVENARKKGWKADPDKYNWPAWSKPKQEHSRMISRLLQMRSHLIFCFRAERKTKSVKIKKNGREYNDVVDAGWKAICAKGIEFETTISFMLVNSETADTRGWVRVGDAGKGLIGPISEDEEIGYALRMSRPLENIFAGKHRLSSKHGEAVAKWAAGGSEKNKAKPAARRPEVSGTASSPPGNGTKPGLYKKIGDEFMARMTEREINEALEDANLKDPGCDLPPSTLWPKVKKALDKAIEAKAERALARKPKGDPELVTRIEAHLDVSCGIKKATEATDRELTRVLRLPGLITRNQKWYEVDDVPWEVVKNALEKFKAPEAKA